MTPKRTLRFRIRVDLAGQAKLLRSCNLRDRRVIEPVVWFSIKFAGGRYEKNSFDDDHGLGTGVKMPNRRR